MDYQYENAVRQIFLLRLQARSPSTALPISLGNLQVRRKHASEQIPKLNQACIFRLASAMLSSK